MNAETTNNQNDDRIFTKSFFLIFGALLFSSMVMYALMSTVTEYATSMGTTAAIAGLVSGIYIFGGLCSRIYSANALERKSWRKLAIVFLSIHFFACIFYFFADNVYFLLIVRFIHGIGFGATANAIVTIASAILPKSRFGEAFGYFMLGTTISVGLGPYISGFFYDNWGAFGSFSLATLFAALGLLCILLLDVDKFESIHNAEIEENIEKDLILEDDSKEESKLRKIIDKIFEVPAIPVSFFTGLTSLGYVSILSFYRLYAAEVNLVSAFSIFFLIYAVVLVVSRPIAGKIQDSHGDRIICFTGIIAQSIGFFLIAFMPSTITVFICAVCAALGFGTLNSACTAIVTRETSANRRPYAISTFFIFCDGTMGFGPALLGTFVSATSGYAPVYFISSFITLLALPVAFLALKR